MSTPSTLDQSVSALVRITWASYESGVPVNYPAEMRQLGYQVSADPEDFGLLDSLNFLGVAMTPLADSIALDARALSPAVRDELDALIS